MVETPRFDGVALNVADDEVKLAQEDRKQFAGRVQQLDKLGLPIGFSYLSPLTQRKPAVALAGAAAGSKPKT